jgi:hypothetical protein
MKYLYVRIDTRDNACSLRNRADLPVDVPAVFEILKQITARTKGMAGMNANKLPDLPAAGEAPATV